MIELIATIIFIISIGGILFILSRKIPVLVSLPQELPGEVKKNKIFVIIYDKINKVLDSFKKQIFLHKLLTKFKIIILRIENRIDILLHKIRKRTQQRDSKDKKPV